MRRRDAIKVLTLPALAAGCASTREGIKVAGVWSGWELTQFRRVLRAFPENYPRYAAWDIKAQSAGDDIAALLTNRVAGEALPGVAVVPFPQLVESNYTRLVPLRSATPGDTGWDDLLTFADASGRRQVYGRWFKVAHKSLVWYRPDLFNTAPPGNWEGWLALCRGLARQGPPPLAIGAADGWVLTDWFENVLLSLDPQIYRRLSRGEVIWQHATVREALRLLGEMWGIPGVFSGGAERALLTQFDQSLLDVFRDGGARMVAGADFAWPFITQYTGYPPERISWFKFPPVDKPAVLVGGDAAVLLRPDTDVGRDLVDWLTAPEAADIWAREGGFLTINDRAGKVGYPSGLRAPLLIQEVLAGSGDGRAVTFDLSDQLGGGLTSDNGKGAWKIFKDFFVDVAIRRLAPDLAVERAVTALYRAARITPR